MPRLAEFQRQRILSGLLQRLGLRDEAELLVFVGSTGTPVEQLREACVALRLRGSSMAMAALERLSVSDNASVRRSAVRQLRRFEKQQRADHRQRWKSRIERLRRELTENGIDDVIACIQQNSVSVSLRSAACEVIVASGYQRAHEVLIETLKSEEPDLVWAAGHSLVIRKSRRATRPLLGLIKTSKTDLTRKVAVYILGFLKDRRSLRALVQLALDRRENPSLRAFAVEALAPLSDDPRMEVAFRSLLEDPEERIRVAVNYARSVVNSLGH